MVYPEHIDKQTVDGTAQNLEALYKLFPSCFTEMEDVDGNVKPAINWGKLRELLGDNVADGEPEVYDFTWVGKRAAQHEAMAPMRKVVKPLSFTSIYNICIFALKSKDIFLLWQKEDYLKTISGSPNKNPCNYFVLSNLFLTFAIALWRKLNSNGRKGCHSEYLLASRVVSIYLKRFQLQSPGKTLLERALEEVRYAVIGVPFLCISFQALFPGQAQ